MARKSRIERVTPPQLVHSNGPASAIFEYPLDIEGIGQNRALHCCSQFWDCWAAAVARGAHRSPMPNAVCPGKLRLPGRILAAEPPSSTRARGSCLRGEPELRTSPRSLRCKNPTRPLGAQSKILRIPFLTSLLPYFTISSLGEPVYTYIYQHIPPNNFQ